MQPLAPTLTKLRTATDDSERDDAWARFVAAHSDIILHACQYVLHDHDAAMDGYVFVLQALRENECQRLHAYVPREGTSFGTWLLVVARRLALDYYRHRYGRSRSADPSRQADHAMRRQIEDLLSEEIDLDGVKDDGADQADASIRRVQLREKLRQSIASLNTEDQLFLALRFRDGRPMSEIARVLRARSVFHLYRRLGAVLDELRRALERRGVDGPEP